MLTTHFSHASEMNNCLLEQLGTVSGTTMVSELRNYCTEQAKKTTVNESETADKKGDHNAEEAQSLRIASEKISEHNPYMLTAYKPNYLLFASYNDTKNDAIWRSIYPDADMDNVESKFQISFKVRIAENIDFLGGADIWGAYTQKSWWQVYNGDQSAPFRETNYEPEVFLRWDINNKILGFKNHFLSFGLNHQSNGRGELLSRSWNRIMVSSSLEKGNLLLVGSAFYRIPEDSEDDDNPDINEYLGYGDLKAIYKINTNTVAMTLTNNLRSDNKGAVQLDWTFPITERFKGYVQYYNGYGESLIDYDETTNRIGVGILLNDWM
jgi:phospholipase A1